MAQDRGRQGRAGGESVGGAGEGEGEGVEAGRQRAAGAEVAVTGAAAAVAAPAAGCETAQPWPAPQGRRDRRPHQDPDRPRRGGAQVEGEDEGDRRRGRVGVDPDRGPPPASDR